MRVKQQQLLLLLAFDTNRQRSGNQASTMEAVANVRECARKGCLSSGLPVEKQYSVDTIGKHTGLRINHKLVGTAKSKSLYWWVPFGTVY